MILKKFGVALAIGLLLSASAFAQLNNFGQTLQIHTMLNSMRGNPSWLLVIRDVDHGQNIPYVYDFKQENNFWMALTYSKNYLITTSELQFAPYSKNPFPYTTRKIKDFCGLESRGRIIRGESMHITITGDLNPYHGYQCNVLKYANMPFNMPQ